MSAKLNIGDIAPEFCLKDSSDKDVCLNDFKGKYVILYFYPKDNTSGCTREAIDFTEHLEEIHKMGAEVIGISPDSVKIHVNFISKHGLKVILLSDPEKKVLNDYGAWQLKKMYGREYMGVVRSTYLIDKNGKILHIWPKVRVKGHVENVIEKLKEVLK